MIYLTREEIITMHDIILKETGGFPGILHLDRLESLEVMPGMVIYGRELYPDIFFKAAVYVREINGSGGHIFIDGNKRTSLSALAEFLKRNSYTIDHVDNSELENFALEVAKGLSFEEIVGWIKNSAKQV